MKFTDIPAFVGEEEVMKINTELSKRNDFTADDIEQLPEDVRAELIDGQIFFMASPTTTHQRLLSRLSFELQLHIRTRGGHCEVFVSPFSVRLADESKNYLEPDLVVICDPDKIKEDGCHGAPDLIIEIISPSTGKRDYGLKMLKYRTAGVKEYWIVDPLKQIVMTYWFEDESQNSLYGFQDEIEFHLFPELKVKLADD